MLPKIIVLYYLFLFRHFNVHIGFTIFKLVDVCFTNFWRNWFVILLQLLLRLVPRYHSVMVQSQLTFVDCVLLPAHSKLFGRQIMSMRAQLKDRLFGLTLLNEEGSVALMSYSVLDACGLKRIGAWILVSDLHPLGRKHIDFLDIA